MLNYLQVMALYERPREEAASLLQKLKLEHPDIATLLEREYILTLSVELSNIARQAVRDMFPSFIGLEKRVIFLRDLYSNVELPPPILIYFEHLYFQQQGEEQAFHNIEDSLAQRQNWSKLRDFYIRYTRCGRLSDLLLKAKEKVLLLATQLAPHPMHILRLLSDWLEEPITPHPLQLQAAIRCFVHHGWYHHLALLLKKLATHELLNQRVDSYNLVAEQLLQRVRSQAPQSFTHAALSLQDLEHYIQNKTNCYESRHILRSSTKLYASQPLKLMQIAHCWHSLLLKDIEDAQNWHFFYELLIPNQQWELLDAILSSLPPKEIPLPDEAELRILLLKALLQHQMPNVDPLPFYVRAFVQDPRDTSLFDITIKLLCERKQWKSLRQIYQLYLVHLKHPLEIFETLKSLLSLYQKQLLQFEQAFQICLMALAFYPDDRAMLTQLIDWSHQLPSNHPVHNILCNLSREGNGSIGFQIHHQAAKAILHPTELDSYRFYTRILQTNPYHIEALHRAREIALRNKRYEDALALYQHELKIQNLPTIRASLLCSMAEIFYRLYQYDQALHTYRLALEQTPQDANILISLAEIYETIGEYRYAISALGKSIDYLPAFHLRIPHLRKIFYIALEQLGDITIALQALRDLFPLMKFSQIVPLIHKLSSNAMSHLPLLSMLMERKADVEQMYRSWLEIEICRMLFLNNYTPEAHKFLREILEQRRLSRSLLAKIEVLALENQLWAEASLALQKQIDLLTESPRLNISLADLYLRLGDLEYRHYNNLYRATYLYDIGLVYNPTHPAIIERLREYLYVNGAYKELHNFLLEHAPHINLEKRAYYETGI